MDKIMGQRLVGRAVVVRRQNGRIDGAAGQTLLVAYSLGHLVLQNTRHPEVVTSIPVRAVKSVLEVAPVPEVDGNHRNYINRCLNCERRILRLHTGTVHARTGLVRCDGRPDKYQPANEKAAARPFNTKCPEDF